MSKTVDLKNNNKSLSVKITAEDLIAQAACRREAKKDPTKHNYVAPIGYHLKGVSTLLDKEGKVKQTWVKTQKSPEDPQALLDAFQIAVAERDIVTKPTIKLQEKNHNKDLLSIYPIGDAHVGLLSWKPETGVESNLEIVEHNLYSAVDKLVSLAPPSDQALIINLGDFFHSDNNSARTERSGARLDVDSRWAKIMRVGVRIMTRCIDRALEKHKKVTVINEIGNHDPHVSTLLGLCLENHYNNNPRVFIDTSPSTFHWFEFGKCLFGVNHGCDVKASELPLIMAYDQKEAWARTNPSSRHFYLGHVHHSVVKEYIGCTVEAFRTLAASDAWHHSKGYRSSRSMVCDVWHREHGRILRNEVGISAL